MDGVSDGKVIGLRSGVEFAHPGKPDKNVIEGLHWLLERAEAGELVGIAYAITYHDDAVSSHFVGRVGRSTVGSLFAIMQRVSGLLDAD